MSLILDALRKMEQDRKNRRGAGGDLRPEVLRYRGEVTSQSGKPYLLPAAGLILLLGGIAAGFLIRGHGDGESLATGRDTAAVNQMAAAGPAVPPATVAAAPAAPGYPAPAATTSAVQPAAAVAAPPAASAQPAALATPAVTGAPAVEHPARQQAPDAAAPAPRSEKSSVKLPANAASHPEGAPAGSAQAAKTGKGRKVVAARAAEGYEPHDRQVRHVSQDAQQPVPVGAPDITISGIAWQDERSLRRAVLNGSLVGEGATVSGARVVEIQETRVRLSRNGRLFDLTLGGSIPR
ncbi:hypothetical protein [Geomonas sp.]|uniref:hypothetical protein n=1 Tax=Geomonas sp. TaxID=2651584 RepID=UPI002B48FD32|nr:hypothetical protein [Geomonas sp.]HJV34950.1 hypothetical protein [Geomonas sp.]